MSKITQLDWSKTAKQFSVNSPKKILCQKPSNCQCPLCVDFLGGTGFTNIRE